MSFLVEKQKYVIGNPNNHTKTDYIYTANEDAGKYAGMVMFMANNTGQVQQAIAAGYIPVDTKTYEDFFLDKIRLNSETKEFYEYTEPAAMTVAKELLAKKSKKVSQCEQYLTATDYIAVKYAGGDLSAEEYASYKTLRQSWRDAINAIKAATTMEAVDAITYSAWPQAAS